MALRSTIIRTYSMLGGPRTFGQALIELAKDDDKIIALSADQRTAGRLEYFQNKYPNNFFNVGIAEQNLIGVAAGFAKEGYKPFTLAQACFSTTRCFDQFKICLGYMHFGVKVVGFGAGLALGQYSATHMSIEDIALIRTLPGVVILSPADCTEVYKCILAAGKDPRPMYIRLTGEMNNPIVYKEDYEYEIGKAITLRNGTDISIIATGSMVYNSLKAADILEDKGISVKVIDMHTIKPLDAEAIKESLSAKLLVTVEEHSVIGGLGSAVSELLAGETTRIPHLILGIADRYENQGQYTYLIDKYGLSIDKIASSILTKYESL